MSFSRNSLHRCGEEGRVRDKAIKLLCSCVRQNVGGWRKDFCVLANAATKIGFFTLTILLNGVR